MEIKKESTPLIDGLHPHEDRQNPEVPYLATGSTWLWEWRFNIIYYTFDNLQKMLKLTFGDKYPKWRLFLTRGYTDGRYIYALDPEHWYSKIKHNRLIKHEAGHIMGYKHTWQPTLMNPTWLLRWSDEVTGQKD